MSEELTDHGSQAEVESATSSTASSSSSADQDEPRLKYTRISSLLSSVFSSDPLSAFLAHTEFLVFATHGGTIHIVSPSLKPERSYKAHSASILSLSTDGHYLASASLDGKVVVGSLTDQKDFIMCDFKRPVNAVALDPNYRSSKTFASGGMAGNLVISERGWLTGRSDFILSSGNGPIVGVDWRGNIIVAMDDNGIKFFHYATKTQVGIIHLPEDAPRADLYRPRISWLGPDRLVVGWGFTVWIVTARQHRPQKAGDGSDRSSILFPSRSSTHSDAASVRSSATSVLSSVRESFRRAPYTEEVYHLDAIVSGIEMFDDNTLLLLCYIPPDNKDDDDSITRPMAKSPELRMLAIDSGEELSADELTLRGYERLGANDYHLGMWTPPIEKKSKDEPPIQSVKPRYYILGALDGVVARERDLNDRFQFLLDEGRFGDAWRMCTSIVSEATRRNVGLKWVQALSDKQRWKETADALSTVLGTEAFHPVVNEEETEERPFSISLDPHATESVTNAEQYGEEGDDHTLEEARSAPSDPVKDEWEHWAWVFINANQVGELTQYLPIRNPQLPSTIYEIVLAYNLKQNPKILVQLLRHWPTTLYDAKSVENLLESYLKDHDDATDLRYCLAQIYINDHRPAKAIAHLLKLRDPIVIECARKFHILGEVKRFVPEILTINVTQEELAKIPLAELREKTFDAVQMVADSQDEVSPEEVINQLSKEPEYQVMMFLYLERIINADQPSDSGSGDGRAGLQLSSAVDDKFADLLVKLYAEYDRPRLADYLKRSKEYNLSEAAKICEERNLIPELVYLLGRAGRSKEALRLIFDKLGDIQEAISFAETQQDPELWEDLVKFSLKRPIYIKALLERAGPPSYSKGETVVGLDPIDLIRRIPLGVEIQGLKQALIKLLNEYELSVSVSRGAVRVAISEVKVDTEKLFNQRQRGIRFDSDQQGEQKNNQQNQPQQQLSNYTTDKMYELISSISIPSW